MMEWLFEKTWRIWVILIVGFFIWKLFWQLVIIAGVTAMVGFFVLIGYLTLTEYNNEWHEQPKWVWKMRNTPVGAILVAVGMVVFVILMMTFSLPN